MHCLWQRWVSVQCFPRPCHVVIPPLVPGRSRTAVSCTHTEGRPRHAPACEHHLRTHVACWCMCRCCPSKLAGCKMLPPMGSWPLSGTASLRHIRSCEQCRYFHQQLYTCEDCCRAGTCIHKVQQSRPTPDGRYRILCCCDRQVQGREHAAAQVLQRVAIRQVCVDTTLEFAPQLALHTSVELLEAEVSSSTSAEYVRNAIRLQYFSGACRAAVQTAAYSSTWCTSQQGRRTTPQLCCPLLLLRSKTAAPQW